MCPDYSRESETGEKENDDGFRGACHGKHIELVKLIMTQGTMASYFRLALWFAADMRGRTRSPVIYTGKGITIN